MTTVNLCYQAGKYTFIATLDEQDIEGLKTRRLMGMHKRQGRLRMLIMETDRIALYPNDLHRMYTIPETGMRIHLNVPIASDVMHWVCPTTDELNALIYFE
nr:MAG: hypothetical protein [Bacteriophage sp.]